MNEYIKPIEAITEMFDKHQVKTLEDSIELVKAQANLLTEYFDNSDKEEDKQWAVKHAILHTFPLLSKMLSSPKVNEKQLTPIYYTYLRVWAFCGRRSLSHFIDYMEKDRPSDNKVYMNRKETLYPIMYYLNKMMFDNKLKFFIFSLPPAYGKTFTLNYFSAWIYGLSINSSILRMSYGEGIVNDASRSIKDLIQSENFSDIFPNFALYKGKPFDKEKEDGWKLKNADVIVNHYVRTRDGATTGVRANKAIIFDDMTKGSDEANNDDLHENYWKKYTTEWWNRRSDDNVKYIFGGTMWSPKDILNRITEKENSISEMISHKTMKYVWVSEDEHAVAIRVPLLDENNESTCVNVMSTTEALKLKEITDPYLFSCVYQQNPIAPSGLEFSYENLRTFETSELVNEELKNYCFAVLDPTRKGKDNISMPIFKPTKDDETHYMIDVLYKKIAMSEAYDLVINKIIENKITNLFVENNTDTSLKSILDMKLKERGCNFCIIGEKYNTAKKEVRIKDNRGHILRRMVFKKRGLVSPNSDYGRFMEAFTKYSFDYANKNDDAPDSLALYVSEILFDDAKGNTVTIINRNLLGF